jgi:hypothetical protein
VLRRETGRPGLDSKPAEEGERLDIHRSDNRFALRRETGRPGLDSKPAVGEERLDIH